MDFTVSTPSAVLSGLYDHLPVERQRTRLVRHQRNVKFGPLSAPTADTALSALVPMASEITGCTIVTNAGEGTEEAGGTCCRSWRDGRANSSALGVLYPKGVFSLSHVALPFPLQTRFTASRRTSRRIRRQSGLASPARTNAKRDRQPGRAAANVVEPILPIHDRAHRRAPTAPAKESRAGVYRRPPLVADVTTSARRRSAFYAAEAFASLGRRRRPNQASRALGKPPRAES